MKKLLVLGFLMIGLFVSESPALARKQIYWFTTPVCRTVHLPLCPSGLESSQCHWCDLMLEISVPNGLTFSFIVKDMSIEPPHRAYYTSPVYEQSELYKSYNLEEILPGILEGGHMVEVTVIINKLPHIFAEDFFTSMRIVPVGFATEPSYPMYPIIKQK